MLTSNKDSEPVGLNNISAQLNTTQASLESNLEYLSLEALRVVCKGIGILDLGPKKEVVARLARKSRVRLGLKVSVGDSELSEKEKSIQLQFLLNRVEGFLEELDVFQRAGDRIWLKPGLKGLQVGTLLNKALVSGDIAFVRLARHIILKRIYVVRVADEDVWAVVSKIVSADTSDPISELLGGKCERARLVAQHFTKPKKCSYNTICTSIALRAASRIRSTSLEPTDDSTRSVWRSHVFSILVRPGWPQLLQGSIQQLQHFGPNIGVLSPIWQQLYSSLPVWFKKDDKNKDPRERILFVTCAKKKVILLISVVLENIWGIDSWEDLQLCSSKLLRECDSTFSDDIEIVKGRSLSVFKKFSMLGGQPRPKVLSFYKREEVLVKKEVGEVRSVGGNSKNLQEKFSTSKSSGSKPSVLDFETRPSKGLGGLLHMIEKEAIGLHCDRDMVLVQDFAIRPESNPLGVFKSTNKGSIIKDKEKGYKILQNDSRHFKQCGSGIREKGIFDDSCI
ncbi:491_t:CDS:2, partial [Racocetra persica]